MGKHRTVSKDRLAGGLLLGAVASGSLAVAALSSAGTASAGCVSISGTSYFSGSGGYCETTTELGNIAVANGASSQAYAGFGGPGNIAIAKGSFAYADAEGGGNFALANGEPGNNNGAAFTGDPFTDIPADANTVTQAYAYGVLNKALAIGNGSTAQSYNFDSVVTTAGKNLAFTQGNGSNSLAISGDLVPGAPASGQIANAIGNAKNALNGTNNFP